MTSCTVITPIGPGHEELAQQAIQSVMLASEHKGAFDNIHAIVGDDTQGKIGRSRARNRMVTGPVEPWMAVFSMGDDQEAAFMSEWLFFLDADDVMCSPRIFGESAFATVAPYLEEFDAIWGTIHELHSNGEVLKRKQVERIKTYAAYVKTPAALSCQMGHFVKRYDFMDLGGFDEDLDVCEDVSYYIRAWKALDCIKQSEPLFLNRRGAHSWMHARQDGERKRYTGREWSIEAERLLKEARRKLDNVHKS